MNITELVSHLPGKGRWRGDTGAHWQCPAHEDRVASLSIGIANNGNLLMHCFAGCTTEDIINRVGLKMSDLMADNGWKAPPPDKGRREIAWYDYRDADGTFLYQVVRFEPKDFRPRRMVGGEWLYNLDDVKMVPYRLNELLKADPEKPIFIVEGEKDADKLASLGQIATTNQMGAMKWKAGWAEYFTGRKVIIIPDNDAAGYRHAEDVKKKLANGPFVTYIHSLEGQVPEKGDISDFLSREHKFDPIEEILADLQHRIDSRDMYWEEKERDRPNSFSIVDMDHMKIELPVGFIGDRLFCPQNVGCIYGPGGVYKTYIAMFLAGQLAREMPLYHLKTRKARILFFSEEMNLPEIKLRRNSIWEAAQILEIGHELRFRFETEFDFWADTKESEKKLIDAIKDEGVTFWIVDSLSRIHSGNENSNSDMIKVGRSLERAARATMSAGMIIHHQGKGGGDNPRTGSGRLRGASTLQNAFSDIINMSPLKRKGGISRSLVEFEKTRHQRPPAAFGISPTFTTDDRLTIEFFDVEDSDQDANDNKQATLDAERAAFVAWMVASFAPGDKRAKWDVIEAYRLKTKVSKRKAEMALLAAIEKMEIGSEELEARGAPVVVWVKSELED